MSDKVSRRYLKNCDKAIMDCFSECDMNILKGHVPLSNRQFTRLKREKTHVRALASKRTSLRKKRSIVQKGFIQALLMPAIATLGSALLSRMICNN